MAAERAQERRQDALSSPSQLWKVTGAQGSHSFTHQLCFYSSAIATLPVDCHRYESTRRQSQGFSRVRSRAALGPLRVRRVLLPLDLVEISSFESSSVFPFLKCVSLVSFVFFRRVDFKRRHAASHFQSCASAVERFSPISVKADNWRRKKKSGLNACAD